MTNMDSSSRYDSEREFSDASAERALASLPRALRISSITSCERLFESIHYLRSVPGFFGDLSGKKVLEVGCGDGWISLRFAKSGAHVWACDISPKRIELAKRYSEAANLDVKFDTMVCEDMTYEDDFFDFVFMHMALHHCDTVAAARQIHRVLKPGGKAVLAEDYAYNPIMRLYRVLTPMRRTEHEQPLADNDLALFVSHFSRHAIEYSGLINIFELSGNRFVRPFTPLLRGFDDFLLARLHFLRKYSKIVVIKVAK